MSAEQPSAPAGLRELLATLARRKGVVVGVALAAVVVSIGASLLQHRVYEGQAELLIRAQQRDPILDRTVDQPADGNRTIRSEAALIESEQLKEKVQGSEGPAPRAQTTTDPNANVIRITIRSSDAARAAALANAYGRAYIDYRRQAASDALTEAGKKLQSKVDDLQSQIDGLSSQIDQLPAASQPTVGQGLTARRTALIAQQVQLQQKVNELQVTASLQDGGATLLTVARTPTSPVSPRPLRNATLGALLGLIAGVALALVLDSLDESLTTIDDVDRVRGDLDVLAEIPADAGFERGSPPEVVSVRDPLAPAAEAYRSLRTVLQSYALQSPLRLLQVTSPSTAEGKTTTVANLAVCLAQAGKQVTVVCCDLRRPRLHKFFGLSNAVGFTSVITGAVPLSAALQPVRDVRRLNVLASGPLPSKASDFLSSSRAEQLLRMLAERSDIVLIDSPPLLPVTDATVLARSVDGVLVVVAAGLTKRDELARALDVLAQVQAPTIGLVLNGVEPSRSYGYYYAQDPHEAVPVPDGAWQNGEQDAGEQPNPPGNNDQTWRRARARSTITSARQRSRGRNDE